MATTAVLCAEGTTKLLYRGWIRAQWQLRGRAISVNLLSARLATRTICMTVPDISGPFLGHVLTFWFPDYED